MSPSLLSHPGFPWIPSLSLYPQGREGRRASGEKLAVATRECRVLQGSQVRPGVPRWPLSPWGDEPKVAGDLLIHPTKPARVYPKKPTQVHLVNFPRFIPQTCPSSSHKICPGSSHKISASSHKIHPSSSHKTCPCSSCKLSQIHPTNPTQIHPIKSSQVCPTNPPMFIPQTLSFTPQNLPRFIL